MPSDINAPQTAQYGRVPRATRVAPKGRLIRKATGPRILAMEPANSDRIRRVMRIPHPLALRRAALGFGCLATGVLGIWLATPSLSTEIARYPTTRIDGESPLSGTTLASPVSMYDLNTDLPLRTAEAFVTSGESPVHRGLERTPDSAPREASSIHQDRSGPRVSQALAEFSVPLEIPSVARVAMVPQSKSQPSRGAEHLTARIRSIVKKYAPKHKNPNLLAEAIVRESAVQGYDPLFVAAVIKSESTFNPSARSHKGAQGLMQIMPATGAWLAKREDIPRGKLTNPGHNLKLGITYLKQLEAEFGGNRVFTLVAYNWGPGHLERAANGKRRIPAECLTYAVKILNDYRRWKAGVI
jgi:soluble lytic murein transglycosylase